MPTARINLVLSESDEVSRQQIREVDENKAYAEKGDTLIVLAADDTDVPVVFSQLVSSKMLLLTASDKITVKLNGSNQSPMEEVTLLVLSATGINSLYLSNETDSPVKVRLHLYGDS